HGYFIHDEDVHGLHDRRSCSGGTVLTTRLHIIRVHPWSKTKSLVDGKPTDVQSRHTSRCSNKHTFLFSAVQKSSEKRGLTSSCFTSNQDVLTGINPIESILKLVSYGNSHGSSPKVLLLQLSVMPCLSLI